MNGQNCGSLTCNTSIGERCCQDGVIFSTTPRCYLPSRAQCALCSRRSSKLCSVNDRCCSETCYNPVTYTCTSGSLCPINLRRCGSACYNPLVYGCNQNNQIFLLPANSRDTCPGVTNNKCPQGQECCPNEITNVRCYNPSSHFCCTAFDVNAIGPKVCPKGQTCCLVQTAAGATNVCYNPTTHYCDLGLQKLCPQNTICTNS